ncbi:putative aminoadipate reductase [Mycena amicta]|nr:putative aminoadipate reductase [Mycena amicta]
MSVVRPLLDGSLSVGEIISFHLTHHNPTPAFSFASEDGTVTNITPFEFARAAHRAAYLLRPQRNGVDGAVVAMVALTDTLLYQTLVAGCIIAGLIPFPMSHRNSEVALIHLLKATNAHRMLTTRGSLGQYIDALTADILAQKPAYALSVQEMPTLAQLYLFLGRETSQASFTPYPTGKKASLNDAAFYLHSSGSTGLPKAIPISHRYVTSVASEDIFAQFLQLTPRLAVGALPCFHAMGVFTQLMSPIFVGMTACIYPPVSTEEEYRVPGNATAESALENAKKARANGIMTVPAFLQEWAQKEDDVEYLKSLNLVAFGGGPLPTSVGDFLVGQGVNIGLIYGGTEFGAPIIFHPEHAVAGEWKWMQFSNRVNVRWDPVGDGTFECQLLTTPTHLLALENLPDVRGYATKDLFERHPTKPYLYRIVGRLDDVLIMANGEKAVPGPMEAILCASPYISGAVMFGRERNQIGVLIEPAHGHVIDPRDDKQLGEFRNLVWSVVEEANVIAPAFAKVYKEMILVVHADRPMVRAPKGTVVKKTTIALYDADITALYDTIEASGNAASDVAPPPSFTATALEPWLLTHASLLSGKEITPAADLFNQGFDSLNATFLRHRIVAALRKDEAMGLIAGKIPQNLVYANPSIRQLAQAIERLVAGQSEAGNAEADARAFVEAMIAKYSKNFDVAPPAPAIGIGAAVILLTGSTGGLGSHIVDILLRHSSVERVYAFNRPSHTSVSQRQEAVFRDRALDVGILRSSKLVYLEGDSAREDLGLSENVFDELRKTVTLIIHNAWVLDFNKSLSTFEPLVRGTCNLIDLARLARARFLFTSSIGSAQNWDPSKGAFPEELQLDAGVALGSGYGESKYVSERILAASGLPATSFRIGQISGANSNGAWSTTDWVPAIVKSSIAFGNFPSDPMGTVSWLPSEAVAQGIVDVALLDRPEQAFTAVNLVHPKPVAWDAVMGAMARVAQLPLVPIEQWLEQLDRSAKDASAQDMENIPAIKLLDVLKSTISSENIQFSTAKAQRISQTMDRLPELCEEDVKRWMRYWSSVGFIHYGEHL